VDQLWLLLIYSVPAEPSRKRAYVWREVKKVGAVYLRDGVCVLPERAGTTSALRAIAAKVDELEGQATLVEGAHLDADRAEWVAQQLNEARAHEYAEIAGEAEQLLAHVERETAHRAFTFAELEELEADLGKLKRWTDQVRARDYFATGPNAELSGLLDRCDQALAAFLEETARADERGAR
jgi:uncharacterized protein YdbL (DUF1318 family)